MARSMDGDILKVGMNVGFKADMEEYGRITKISGDDISVAVWDGYEGREKIMYTWASDVWVEE